MSASELMGLPSLPPTTQVYNSKRRFGRTARLIQNPLNGWIGWVEPKEIPGAKLTGTARVKYFWRAADRMWFPVLPRESFMEAVRESFGCWPEMVGPGAD